MGVERAGAAAVERPSSPVPFSAGAVGYFGYGAGWFEAALPEPNDADGMPDIAFALYDTMLVTCHRTGTTWISAPTQATRDALRDAVEGLETGVARVGAGAARARELRVTDRASYEALVARAQEHIAAGDAYELCLTHRIAARFDGSTWDLYRALRAINPAPHATYLELPEGAIVCASPERFLRLDGEGCAESRPIKGTRPRGTTPEEDRVLRDALASSEKDRAENTMIVDLVRNDLGRVCAFGSVEVAEIFAVETQPTVHQLVSTVRGRLAEGKDAIDLVRACFPPGSMTGAPKIEAMKILNALERDGRGVYSGAIGWIDVSGTMDLAVVIRSIVVSRGVARIGVGGAIVADSTPSDEYEETRHKARASLAALGAG
jgi:aminodeoxychorismate synthase component I